MARNDLWLWLDKCLHAWLRSVYGMFCWHLKGGGKITRENLWIYVSNVKTCNKWFESFTSESVPQTLQITTFAHCLRLEFPSYTERLYSLEISTAPLPFFLCCFLAETQWSCPNDHTNKYDDNSFGKLSKIQVFFHIVLAIKRFS